MENVSDMSLNDDEGQPAIKPPQGPQPMVVVQYRQRGVPWWLLSLLTVLVPICTILIYHSLVVGRYRAQTVEAAEAVKTFLHKTPAVEVKKPAQVAVPLALNSQPIAAAVEDTATDPPSTGAATAKGDRAAPVTSTVVAADPAKPGTNAGAVAPAATDKQPAPAASPVTSPPALIATTAKAAVEFGKGASNGVAKTNGTEPSGGSLSPVPKPGLDSNGGGPAVTVSAAKNGTERTPSIVNGVRDPFEELNEEIARGKAAPPAEANRVGQLGDLARATPNERPALAEPGDPANPGGTPRLPTKEETLRQIESEAAQNAAAIREQENERVAELRSARYRERVKFREELRAILGQGLKASETGSEIDRLLQRYSFDAEEFRHADLMWQRSRASAAVKAKMVRSLDLPESVIMTLLCDDVNRLARSRNGPRNASEVRIRAAQQLLRLELPPETEMTAIHQPVDAATGRTARYRIVPGEQPVQRRR
jgi:hypothetical protein